jgi:hypothetical protein
MPEAKRRYGAASCLADAKVRDLKERKLNDIGLNNGD